MKTPRLQLPSSLVLVFTLMIGNFLNFLFNALLGRILTFEQFGQLTLFTTLWAIISIFLNSFGGTVNHKVAYLFATSKDQAISFYRSTISKAILIALAFTAVWVLSAGPLSYFFNIKDYTQVIYFAPVIIFGILLSSGRGFLQGIFHFRTVAFLILLEPIIKLISAIALKYTQLSDSIYLAIPISVFATLIVLLLIDRREIAIPTKIIKFNFPKAFLFASVLSGFSTYAFATFDVLLAKHFLDETAAGQYALLSLVGKMIFFFGSVLNGLIVTYVSRQEGLLKKNKNIFNILFTGSVFFTIASTVVLGPLGFFSVPLLLGSKASFITAYLTTYAVGTALFTIANVLVVYHLARKQYIFSVLSLINAITMIVGIFISHDSIQQIVNVFLFVSFIQFLIISVLHFILDYGKYFIRNVIDLIDLFAPLPKKRALPGDKKRILVFNWRDTEHTHGGGAEVYVHEIAKRLVSEGNQVTLFCGNDTKSKRYEIIDGIEIIRRGGFHTVYIWAFVYYFFRFRGCYDAIIDCQNGVPFFTPLYAKEPVYAVIYHVHQDVFKQFLGNISATLASGIEKYIMPRAYKHAQFITISESTKEDMVKQLGINEENIDIVYCGVDLDELSPGKKSLHPTALCLGRLKAYKSVHVVIRAFVKVVRKFPSAELIIAGTGEEEGNLKMLTKELHLENNVTFAGRVTELQKKELLQKAWIFVNPSMMEGWGITSIEANACGTAVIASDVPGLRDSVRKPYTGYLVEYGNVNKFAEKIIEVLQNRHTRKRMEKYAVEWSKKFSWNNSAIKLANIL